MRHLLYSLFIVGCCFKTFAQQPFMWHLTDEDGLPSMEVYNVMQDSRSYMWFGTDNGLCRYDGKNFKIYYHPKQRGKAFSYLVEDVKHRIWTLNFAGQIFYIENDSMHLFEPFERVYKSGFPRFCFDKQDQLWILSPENPIYRYNFTTHQLTPVPTPNLAYPIYILADDKGDVIVAGDHIQILHNDQCIKTYKGEIPLEYSNYDKTFYGFTQKSPQNSISQFDPRKGFSPINTQAIEHNRARITDFASFGPNNRWLLTFDGVYHFYANPDSSYLYSHLLKGNVVSWLIRDKEENYWISTLKNGVFIVPSTDVWLLNSDNSAIENNRVAKIVEDQNGLLYLGGGKGIITIFDPAHKKIVGSLKFSSDNKDIDALNIDKRTNTLYVQSNKAYIYDLKKKKILSSFLNFSSAKDFSFDSYGNYLVGANYYAGLVLTNENGKQSPFYSHFKFNHYTYKDDPDMIPLTSTKLRSQRSNAVQVNEHDTTLWVAYVDGLYCFKEGIEHNFKDESGKPIFGTDISLSPDGTMWVSTVQQGIIGIRNQKIISHLTQSSGLKSDFIRCIKSTNEMLWFGTDKGVQGYNIANKTFASFSREDGLVTNDVMDIYIKNNVIYLATSKGLQWFTPTQLRSNLIAPPIYIDGISVNDSMYGLSNNLNLNYTQNNISIAFTGIAISSRGNMQYSYRLVGLDSNWKYIPSSDNIVRFNALPSGEYSFEIKAINEDGVSSPNAASISFTIEAPYWQRWWFVILVLIAVAALVSLAFLIRINVMRRRNNLERDKAKLEVDLRTSQLSALKVQMNPHFIFNSLNSIQEYILTNEKKLANSYLGKFSDLMRLYLDMSNKTSIALSEEIRSLELYLELEAMRFETNFSYSLEVEEGMLTDEMQIPAMIIQPYVENAIKHGLLHKRNSRVLSIKFKPGRNQNSIVCIVQDNGIGRKQSHELNTIRNRTYTSFATGATQKRLELLNAERKEQIGVVYDDLYHTDGSSLGTRVTLTIPTQL